MHDSVEDSKRENRVEQIVVSNRINHHETWAQEMQQGFKIATTNESNNPKQSATIMESNYATDGLNKIVGADRIVFGANDGNRKAAAPSLKEWTYFSGRKSCKKRNDEFQWHPLHTL